MNITITHILTVSEPLRTLLADLATALRGASAPAPARAMAPAEGAADPGRVSANGVSFLNSPAAVETPPPAPSLKKKGGGGRARWLTPERTDWLTREWPGGVSPADAFATLQAMPGDPVPSEGALKSMVRDLGLRRSPETIARMHAQKAALMRAARWRGTASAPPENPPLPPVPARGKPAPVTADHETILRWGAEHGCHQERLDLDAMNARRRQFGLPPFEVRARRAA